MVRAAFLLVLSAGLVLSAQEPPANYDEAKVPAYTLPDPLTLADGSPVRDAETWRTRRRPEVLRLFVEHVFGPVAPRLDGQRFIVREQGTPALDGKAIRRQVRVLFTGEANGPYLDLLLYLPAGRRSGARVPSFLGLNFAGNHGIHPDPGITLSDRWVPANYAGVVNNRATGASRGSAARRYPIETILDAGFALATVYCGDLEPDHPEGWRDGIRGRVKWPSPDRAPQSAMGAWSWGLSRAMDYLAADPDIDPARVAVWGHSRLGKAALWAGAQDERFALVISNNSGEGGAAITRRRFGETLERITARFTHWFVPAYRKYADREDALPVDSHMLLALAAPRPLYVASAVEDRWADPKGEFLGALGAEPVYALFGRKGLGVREMPPVDKPVGDTIGYHVRSGGHDVTPYDWQQYLAFAARHLQ